MWAEHGKLLYTLIRIKVLFDLDMRIKTVYTILIISFYFFMCLTFLLISRAYLTRVFKIYTQMLFQHFCLEAGQCVKSDGTCPDNECEKYGKVQHN